MMTLENKRTCVRISAMKLPGLKKPCLVVDTTNGLTKHQNHKCICKYASFNNDFAADTFMLILSELVGAEREEEE